MSIAEDATIVADMAIRDMMVSTKALNELRTNNEGRQVLVNQAEDIELTRDLLSRILDDVRGV